MGADVYLTSVATDEVCEAVTQSLRSMPRDTAEEVIRFTNLYYERLVETGGYFRDPYNENGLLPALGMDWGRDVHPLLNSEGELSIAGARHLLAELERRPIAANHLIKRRERLIALLRCSIELNEPLVCRS